MQENNFSAQNVKITISVPSEPNSPFCLNKTAFNFPKVIQITKFNSKSALWLFLLNNQLKPFISIPWTDSLYTSSSVMLQVVST